MPSRANRSSSLQFDHLATSLAALVVVGLAVFLIVRNQPISDPRLFFIMRVVLSFAVALLGAAIPGFLNIGSSGRGLVIRAGEALALFLLTFVYTPDLVTDSREVVNQSSSGALSPPIAGNAGEITITGGAQN